MNKLFGIIGSVLGSDNFLDLFKGKERRLLEFQNVLADKLHQANENQIKVNMIEAKNTNIFVSGWRPFIGWVCGSALLYQFILRDLISYVMLMINSEAEFPPEIETGQLISILLSMLGMAGYRSYERLKGKS